MTTNDHFVANPLHIRCADAIELVSDYLDGELNAHDLARFESHIDNCEGCTVFIDQIKMTITLTRSAGTDQVKVLPKNFDDLVTLLHQNATPPTNL